MNKKTELECILRVPDVRSADREIVINATADECKAIALRFGLMHLEALEAKFTTAQWRKRGISLSGRIRADLEQSCSVSLEPVKEDIDVAFKALFWPAEYAGELADEGIAGEIFSDISSDDSPELYENNEINAGEAVLEYFALSLNFYPRKPGINALEYEEKQENGRAEPSPFQVLKGMDKGGE